MKPLKLKLEAFGSFAGKEEIDFEALAPRGLFVVGGDTGTGKTTIFDAMCWALYGDMPLKESKGVRSDHVAPETRTRVELTFECGGERYVVDRNPEQLRPAKGGTGYVNEPASAHLMRITDTGTEPIATSARETAKACVDLIGLDAEQFQRVILLPQGDFSKFLLAGTDERETLLSQLFGGQVYDGIIDELKAERDSVSSQLDEVNKAVDGQLAAARTNLQRAAEAMGIDLPDTVAEGDREHLGTLLDTLDTPTGDLRSEVRMLAGVAREAAGANSLAIAEASRFAQATDEREVLARLDEDQPAMDAKLRSASTSAAARPIAAAADAMDRARAYETTASAELEERLVAISEGFASLGVEADTSSVTSINDLLEARTSDQKSRAGALEELNGALNKLDGAKAHLQDIDEQSDTTDELLAAATKRETDIDAAIPGLRARAVDPAGIVASISQIEDRVAYRKEFKKVQADLVTATDDTAVTKGEYGQVLQAFVATQAPRLAESLVEHEPCPVCGAVEHPNPAVSDGDTPATLEELELASSLLDAANTKVGGLKTRVAELRTLLGDDVDASIADLETKFSGLQSQLEAATEAASQLADLVQDRAEVHKEKTDRGKAAAILADQAATAKADVAAASSALANAEAAAVGIDADEVTRTAAELQQIADQRVGLEGLFTSVAVASAATVTCERELEEALTEGSFDTVEAARSVVLTPEDERAYTDAVTQHRADRQGATERLNLLTEQGIPEQPDDLDATAKAAEAAAHAYEGRAGVLTTVTDALKYTDEALGEHDRLLGGSGDQRKRAELLERAYQVCRYGGPEAEMSLKRWVLTRELDRVTDAANVHLGRMTGERYTLKRRETRQDGRRKFGLDLDVFDSQTGRPRSTRSLSGGEQFQASLALALGLADVVSHGGTGSGKSFDALFVDEGFGSLSAQSLDDAIETLHQLHATGRMVGAITHVEAMKQQLHVGIEVVPREDGRGSTIVVHP